MDTAGLDVDRTATCLAKYRPEGIVSFVDDNIETAAALAARLGLRYHTPEVAKILVDKRLQRAAFQKAGIPGPNFWTVTAGLPRTEVAQLAARMTYPAVLKPAEGSGSRGIQLASSPGELLSLLDVDGGGVDCVLEEYLRDDPARDVRFASYLSVESVISSGHVSHVAITGRFPLAEPFRETGNFIPGVLEQRLHRPVLEMVEDAVDALGIVDSVIHTEIKLTPDGPRLIEVNGRLGGRPPFVLQSVSSVNMFTVACQIAAGTPVRFEHLANCQGVGFWLMLQPPTSARQVLAIEGLDEVSALCGIDVVTVNRRPGTEVDWREGTDSRVVTVRGHVADHDALAEKIESIRHALIIRYDG
ncbi:MAG: ATP-grasp domain-containing protein [Acidimicrobiales bacterium]